MTGLAAGFAVVAASDPCPCGRGERFGSCCGAMHAGAEAPTAERLMRARYSAFVVGDADFLLASWHPGTRPDASEFELEADTKWLRLLVEATELGGPFDQTGTVTFAAIGRTSEGRFEQREHSRFLRGGSTGWQYVDGDSMD
ncbi:MULTISPECIES: YchJ family protein [unclassified Leucobacter]|uniref:YchJ family protein n=1 Tax=unclassified Leucobacter TaxID=2621730 RepID=UPI001F13C34C|nr:YchJ family metal-binding protein [Leucobacter sp. CX169]